MEATIFYNTTNCEKGFVHKDDDKSSCRGDAYKVKALLKLAFLLYDKQKK